jgi:hypothetical protein
LVGTEIVVALNDFTRDYQIPAVENGPMFHSFGFVAGKIREVGAWKVALKPELSSGEHGPQLDRSKRNQK